MSRPRLCTAADYLDADAWTLLRPDPKESSRHQNRAPKVSAGETMAAASLEQASRDGNVDGVQQALAAGPAPQPREGEHEAAKKVARVAAFMTGQSSPPLQSPSDFTSFFISGAILSLS